MGHVAWIKPDLNKDEYQYVTDFVIAWLTDMSASCTEKSKTRAFWFVKEQQQQP